MARVVFWGMFRPSLVSAISLVSLCACDATAGRHDTEPADCPSIAPDAGRSPGDELPARVECTLYFRQSNEVGEGDDPADPKFQFQEEVVSVARDEDASATLGELTLNVSYDVDEFEGSSAHVSVTAQELRLFSTLYQIGREGVANQFVGDHGFTGLMYLTHPSEGGDYQLICKAL